jgi:hypothetical protein
LKNLQVKPVLKKPVSSPDLKYYNYGYISCNQY